MNRQELDKLLDKFIEAERHGQSIYLDSDQITEILDLLEDEEDFDLYDRLLATGLKLHPENTQLLIKKSKVLMCNEDFKQALSITERLNDNDSGELFAIRINCLFATGQTDKAYSILNNLTETDFEELDAVYEFVATFLNEMNMNKEAYQVITKGVSLFPDNLYIKNELCYLMEISDDINKAIKICKEMIDSSPYSSEFWFSLGRLYSIAGEFNKAIDAFDFAITCSNDDNDYDIKILKAYCQYMITNYEAAIEIYKELIENEELRERLIPLMAECYMKLHQYEESYLLMKPYIYETGKMEISMYLNYIRCCMETERVNEARQIIDKAVNLYPRNINLLYLQSISYIETNEEDKAIANATKMLEALSHRKDSFVTYSFNNNADTLFRLGQKIHQEGDIEKALRYYKEAFKADSRLKFINLYMAIGYLQKKDMENFSRCLQKISSDELMNLITDITSYEIEKEVLSHNNTELIHTAGLAEEYLKNKNNYN